MKNILITGLVVFVSISQIFAQSKWNIGVSTGCVTNISKFDSGDEQANALFENYPTKSFGMGVNFKYKISEKFDFQTGIAFNQIGFTYGFLEDYSLIKPYDEGSDDVEALTCMASIPAMVLFNTKKTCNNFRWVFGLGTSIRAIDKKWDKDDLDQIPADEGGNTNPTIMTSSSETSNCISPSITWQIGIEKVMAKGNSFSFVFTGNQGLMTIAESTVNYTATNKNYTHTFINRGSYVNLAFAYNFMAFGTKKAMRAAK